jgi:fatty acid desaturase
MPAGASISGFGDAAMKNWRDWQSIAYLVAVPALAVWMWMQSDVSFIGYWLLLTLIVGVACISHNHAHVPIWRSTVLNALTDFWIGTLQGHPVFLFQPAHIDSHHRYNQGEKDITRVLRYASHNNLLGYLVFPFRVLPPLNQLKRDYIRSLWYENRSHFWRVILSHDPLIILWSVALAIDPNKALIFVIVPQIVGLHFLLASNYLQHAHALPGSRYNHSRNFTGPINAVWFNVGYHTAHHEHPTSHWSNLPQLHAAISDQINPRLNERSLGYYTIKTMLLGNFVKRFQSQPVESP